MQAKTAPCCLAPNCLADFAVVRLADLNQPECLTTQHVYGQKKPSELFSKYKENEGLKPKKCFYSVLSKKSIPVASLGNTAECKTKSHAGAHLELLLHQQ